MMPIGVLSEYRNLFLYLIFSLGLAIILFLVSYFGVLRSPDAEKVSAYECGFDPFEAVRGKFDVRFYLVAILFIIFDLEVTFLFPWSVCLSNLGVFGFMTMALFLVILTVGFIYEWSKGALDWE